MEERLDVVERILFTYADELRNIYHMYESTQVYPVIYGIDDSENIPLFYRPLDREITIYITEKNTALLSFYPEILKTLHTCERLYIYLETTLYFYEHLNELLSSLSHVGHVCIESVVEDLDIAPLWYRHSLQDYHVLLYHLVPERQCVIKKIPCLEINNL